MKTTPVTLLAITLAAAAAILLTACASTGQNFSSDKVTQIKKGETTEAELVQWFGPPENRSLNSEGQATLSWQYGESRVKGESFIPYAGAFMGGQRSKHKSLNVTLGADGKVSRFDYSGGGTESRGTTQDEPKK